MNKVLQPILQNKQHEACTRQDNGSVRLSCPSLIRLVSACFLSQNTIKSAEISRLSDQPNTPFWYTWMKKCTTYLLFCLCRKVCLVIPLREIVSTQNCNSFTHCNLLICFFFLLCRLRFNVYTQGITPAWCLQP